MDTQLVSHCPHCRSAVKVRESHFGQPVRCPACRKQFAVSSIETPFSAGASLAAAPAALETLDSRRAAPTDPESLLPPPVLPRPALPLPAPQARAQLGRLGRFELSRLLGQGSFGRVYQAYDPQLERYVALKVPIFGPGDKKKIQRFLAEAKAAARLRHPNIVFTYESGQIDGQYYIAAQFVPGQTLSQRLKDAPIDFRQAAEWVRQLAEALAYAHFQGIIHRDIKPDNIMIDEKGVPQIMDFGLAKRVNEDAEMTTDGSILGTPAYMAPEQARGNQVHVGPHSDQYSLGVVLYELLTGKRPFAGSPHAVIEQLLGKEPPAPRAQRPEIPRDLEAICHKAMAKEISGRYASTAELAGDLASFLRGDATLARPISPIERAARWGRRNPVVAALSGALGLVVLLGITSNSIALWKAEAAKQELARKAAAWDNLVKQHDELIGNAEKAGEEKVELGKTLDRLNEEIADRTAKINYLTAKIDGLNAEIAGLNTEIAARPEEIAALSAQIDELTAKIDELTEPDRKYRASIQRAFEAQKFSDSDTAKRELVKRELLACPPIHRAWEWHLLMAAAEHFPHDLPRVVKQGISRHNVFLFSDDGKRLLQGYRGAFDAKFVPDWDFIDLEKRRAPFIVRAPEILNSDKVWALSETTGQEALIVMNNAATGFAEPYLQSGPPEKATEQEVPDNGLFNRHVYGTTLVKFDHRVPGFALDAKQVAGQWLVLSCSIDPESNELRPWLSLHSFASPKSKPKTQDTFFSPPLHAPDSLDGRVCGACFDESGKQVHLFLQRDAFLRWYGIPLNGEKEAKPELILKLARTFAGGREHVLHPHWRPQVCDGQHLVIHESGGAKSQVVFCRHVRDDLSALVAGSASRFDPQGKRLFIFRAGEREGEQELQIFDPIPTQPTEPLLTLPLGTLVTNPVEGFPILSFSPSGQQLAVAFNGQVIIYDVSDCK